MSPWLETAICAQTGTYKDFHHPDWADRHQDDRNTTQTACSCKQTLSLNLVQILQNDLHDGYTDDSVTFGMLQATYSLPAMPAILSAAGLLSIRCFTAKAACKQVYTHVLYFAL